MRDTLESIECALRSSVAAGQFEAVPALAESYAAAVESSARQMETADPGFAELQRHSLDLLAWARENALANRAHAVARLQEIMTARQYAPARPEAHVTDTFA